MAVVMDAKEPGPKAGLFGSSSKDVALSMRYWTAPQPPEASEEPDSVL